MKPEVRWVIESELASWEITPIRTGLSLTLPSNIGKRCSAAFPPAAWLSVEAVALIAPSGAPGTPESNPMIGMFLLSAMLIASNSASVSKAAKAMALGFLLMALFNCSNCSAIAVSFCGPTKLILAPNSLAAFSAPLLTAFQKSCWKPLAITSTRVSSACATKPVLETPPKVNKDAKAAIASLNDFFIIGCSFFCVYFRVVTHDLNPS